RQLNRAGGAVGQDQGQLGSGAIDAHVESKLDLENGPGDYIIDPGCALQDDRVGPSQAGGKGQNGGQQPSTQRQNGAPAHLNKPLSCAWNAGGVAWLPSWPCKTSGMRVDVFRKKGYKI